MGRSTGAINLRFLGLSISGLTTFRLDGCFFHIEGDLLAAPTLSAFENIEVYGLGFRVE